MRSIPAIVVVPPAPVQPNSQTEMANLPRNAAALRELMIVERVAHRNQESKRLNLAACVPVNSDAGHKDKGLKGKRVLHSVRRNGAWYAALLILYHSVSFLRSTYSKSFISDKNLPIA